MIRHTTQLYNELTSRSDTDSILPLQIPYLHSYDFVYATNHKGHHVELGKQTAYYDISYCNKSRLLLLQRNQATAAIRYIVHQYLRNFVTVVLLQPVADIIGFPQEIRHKPLHVLELSIRQAKVKHEICVRRGHV